MTNLMLGEALRMVCGPLKDLHERLCGKNGDEWMRALSRMMRKENFWGATGTPTFSNWVTLQLNGWSARKYLRALQESNFSLGSDGKEARSVLRSPHFEYIGPSTIQLVLVDFWSLGYRPKPMQDGVVGDWYKNIIERAREYGLSPCPHEVAPALRLSYVNQPSNETLLVITEPIKHIGYVGGTKHEAESSFSLCGRNRLNPDRMSLHVSEARYVAAPWKESLPGPDRLVFMRKA